jgi:tricorn protease
MYARFPSLSGDRLFFTSEDDIWSLSTKGGAATRLTSTLGAALAPVASPDGRWLAYLGRDEGSEDIWVMPSEGGPTRRLSYTGSGSLAQPVAWTADSKSVIGWSSQGGFHRYQTRLWAYPLDGSPATQIPAGNGATEISYAPKGGANVIGRNTGRGPEREAAWWKRYRGGTAGVLWIDVEGNGQYRPFASELKGNLSDAHWVGDRVYFLSDHEGVSNIYSKTPQDTDLKRHTSSRDFYLRHLASDGKTLAWMKGGELFTMNPAEGKEQKIDAKLSSSRTQLQRKFVSAKQWLETADLHPKSHQLLVVARGKVATIGNWDGPAVQHGVAQGVRYRAATWLSDGKRFAVVSDASLEERLELRDAETAALLREFRDFDCGIVREMRANPRDARVAFSNHRAELWAFDLDSGKSQLVERGPMLYGIRGFDWSPCGKYLAYALHEHASSSRIKIWDGSATRNVTDGSFSDISPSFDPEGKYLSFLSQRNFNPVYDSSYFELSFPANTTPYLAVLAKDTPSPFTPPSKAVVEAKGDDEKGSDREKKDDSDAPKILETRIDWDGLENRVLSFPLASVAHNYAGLESVKGGVVLLKMPIEGSKDGAWLSEEEEGKGEIEFWDFKERKAEIVSRKVSSLARGLDGQSLLLTSGKRVRLGTVKSLKDATKEEGHTPKSGWVDLKRVHFEVEPRAEWKQMYREAWRLQRDYFWDEKMCGIDWQAVHDRYAPVVERVGARSEISDLIWELHGELGTSHAYEMMGDYRRPPRYAQGHLGADITWDEKAEGWRINNVLRGDTWDEKISSPLLRPGVNVQAGDVLRSISGLKLSRTVSPDQLLVNRPSEEVQLEVQPQGKGESRRVSVKTIPSEYPLRYREWVEGNRRYVHEASGGKLGYLHIPNMVGPGFSEFHRAWANEVHKGALLVDVRYNGGGHVSQLLLEKLARKRIGWDLPRHGTPEPYPAYTVGGPMLALTNEYAGSDGDIFSHGFKLMKLGPLVGKRTWGGVVGIFPQRPLVDGTWTSQPQFATWFQDVQWDVENYGTDPDVVVENRPQDDFKGDDVQLKTSVKMLLEMLAKTPSTKPDFVQRPNFAPKIGF